GHLPDSTGILFQTDLGNVGSKSVTVGMASGQASATLHADEGPGTAHVLAELDKETQNDQVTIMEAPTPTPTATPSPTPTETPTPKPTPTATPTPTPTATPAPELTQGDVDCNGSVSSVDALKELRHVANLLVSQTLPCPEIGTDAASIWGDVDCSGQVTSVDALKILRHVASLPVIQNEPCPDIGDREN
ncbi:MAG TPA: hypothetical protein VLS25_07905, partial [Dehalococcoidia bacterium]|nr:hypothetical protein [Dehalococcoidia bacterium]